VRRGPSHAVVPSARLMRYWYSTATDGME
jgi:hypothetical protein